MQRLRTRRSWQVVNAMFKRPPRSTEQILHYRKYWDGELPERIRSRKLATLAGHEMIRRDVLGEFQLGLYLEQGVGAAAARQRLAVLEAAGLLRRISGDHYKPDRFAL